MVATPEALPLGSRKPPLTFSRLLIAYLAIMLIPYLWSVTQDLAPRGLYITVVGALSIGALTAFMAQYALAGRLDTVTRVAGIDNSMRLHRKAGELIAIYFFLHPFLIVLPRFFIAPQLAVDDLWLTLTAADAVTGVYAWALMAAWVLMAVYRDKLPISYEAWRFSHGIGLIAIAILATLHAVNVGRHGVYEPWFDVMWIAMCTVAVGTVAFTYFVRPYVLLRKPFKIVDVKKEGLSDWALTIEKDGEFDFDFDGGQFVWINTSGNPFNREEHPFSIASSPNALPRVSFIIRELGDYTSSLDRLEPGQRVFVDGPHGVFTLTDRKAAGIALIAGGCGIAAALGILRQLRDLGDPRPVRLIYGNRVMEQMVCQDDIATMRDSLPNFEQILVLEEPPDESEAYEGLIDRTIIQRTFDTENRDEWMYYVCGSSGMVGDVVRTLRELKVPEKQILYEQLAF